MSNNNNNYRLQQVSGGTLKYYQRNPSQQFRIVDNFYCWRRCCQTCMITLTWLVAATAVLYLTFITGNLEGELLGAIQGEASSRTLDAQDQARIARAQQDLNQQNPANRMWGVLINSN